MEEVDTSYLVLVLNLDWYLSSMEIHWYLIQGIWNVLSNFPQRVYTRKVLLWSTQLSNYLHTIPLKSTKRETYIMLYNVYILYVQ